MTTLVVLAAGLASRYGSDKQLAPVGQGGELLLEYALHDAWRAGCRRAVLVIRTELHDAFAELVVPAWRDRLDVALAVQRLDDVPVPVPAGRQKPWGTAHAVLAARPHLDGDFLVCNADDFYGASAFRTLVECLAADRADAVAGYPLAATLSPHGGVARALCHAQADGRLVRIEERTGITREGAIIQDDAADVLAADAPVSMNLWAFRHSFVGALQQALAEFLRTRAHEAGAELRIPDVVNELVAAGRDVRVLPVTEPWFGMTWAADHAAVRAALAERVALGHYPADLRVS